MGMGQIFYSCDNFHFLSKSDLGPHVCVDTFIAFLLRSFITQLSSYSNETRFRITIHQIQGRERCLGLRELLGLKAYI